MNLDEQVMGDEAGCDQAALHQMMLEREQMAEEAAKRLAQHTGDWQDIELLCALAGIRSPYETTRKELK